MDAVDVADERATDGGDADQTASDAPADLGPIDAERDGADRDDAPGPADAATTDVPLDVTATDVTSDAADATVDTFPPDVVADVPLDTADALICRPGTTACGGACVVTTGDPANCGACGRVCPGVAGGTPTCVAGVCDVECTGGYHRCGGACAADTSPASCGTSCTACSAPTGAIASCSMGTCGWSCGTGFERVGGGCDVRVPRPIAPLSTANVTSHRPLFRWELALGTDGASIEICRTRSCVLADIVQTFDGSGTSGAPSGDLAPGVWFWRIRGRRGGAYSGRTGPVWQFTVGSRGAPRDSSWGSPPDVNGDGFSDVVVGAPFVAGQTGRVHIHLGSALGVSTAPISIDSAAGTGGQFGFSVASAGDIDGDGFADLIVGASAAPGGAGSAHIFLGRPSGLATVPITLSNPDALGTIFGWRVASTGDVNGDGYADVVVSAQDARTNGHAYVFFGGLRGPSVPTQNLTNPGGPDAGFGTALAGSCDVNADGFADVLVGSPAAGGRVGAAYLYLGGPTGLAAVPSVLAGRDGVNSSFGVSVACAGDVNGDGYGDVVIGAPGAAKAYVYSGGAAGLSDTPTTVTTAESSSGFGSSVSSAGDLNGDGYTDVIVGAFQFSGNGRALVFLGSASGLTTTPITLSGTASPAMFGSSVAGAGDVNTDGFADVLVGDPTFTPVPGIAYVFLGGPAGPSTSPTATLMGPDGAGDAYGWSLARAVPPRAPHPAAPALPLRPRAALRPRAPLL